MTKEGQADHAARVCPPGSNGTAHQGSYFLAPGPDTLFAVFPARD